MGNRCLRATSGLLRTTRDEDLLNLKAEFIYRWVQRHRRDDSYFGVGYANGKYEDAQFSCDLGEVGMGLIGFHKTTGKPEALTDAKGLAQYFLTEHEPDLHVEFGHQR